MSISASPLAGPSHRAPEDFVKALYNYCQANFDSDHAVTQQDLVKSNVIPNGNLTMIVGAINELVNQRLFKAYTTRDGASVWKIAAHDSAAKYNGLDSEQAVVYQCIESSDRAGIWSKTIKLKTSLHTKRVESALKFLINAQLIKQCKSVKYPSRVMYILYHLQPSEDVTGGAFFTDGQLDAVLVHQISWVLELQISRLSWHETVDHLSPPSSKDKERSSMTKAEAEAIREAVMNEDHRPAKQQKTSSPHRTRASRSPDLTRSRPKVRYLSWPAGYTGYPTLPHLTNYINKSKLVDTVLPTSAVNSVLEVLVYDDKVIKMVRRDKETNQESTVYKARRTPDVIAQHQGALSEREGNGLTEIPCGRCPVFDLCQEGGPVNPESCEYWNHWIEDMKF